MVNLIKYENLEKLDYKEILIKYYMEFNIAFFLLKLIIKSLSLKIDILKLYL